MENGQMTVQEKEKKGGYGPILLIMAGFIVIPVGIAILLSGVFSRIGTPMSRGDKYLDEKNYVLAAAAYREAIRQNPKNVEAYEGIVEAYRAQGDDDAALHMLEKGYENTGDEHLEKRMESLRESIGPVIVGNGNPDPGTEPGPGDTVRERQIELLQKAYDLLSVEDYDTMCSVDGSDEADLVIAELKGDHVIYIPEEGNHGTGTGCGVYKVSSGYFFYYGDYVDGERKGHGVSYWYNGHGYEIYDGEWADDAPNGEGFRASVESDPHGTDEWHYGTFKDGVEDGDFTLIVENKYNSTTLQGEYTVNYGRPEEATDALKQVEEDYENMVASGKIDYDLENLYQEYSYSQTYGDETIFVVFDDYTYQIYYRYGEIFAALGYR